MRKLFKNAYVFVFLFSIVFLFAACQFSDDVVNVEEFEKQTFFLYGKNYDRCIDSDEELKYFVWHSVLYQENNLEFYVNMENQTKYTINNKVIDALASYPEYVGIDYSYNSTYVNKDTGSNIYALTNFTYYLESDKAESEPLETYGKTSLGLGSSTDKTTKYVYAYTNGVPSVKKYTRTTEQATDWTESTADEILPHAQDQTGIVQFSTAINNRSYEKNGDGKTTAEFAIDASTLGIYAVYNSEQLLAAVMYGKRPVFTNATSVAYTIYQNAKSILRQINTDAMTDYQKTLNIYDYIIGHNTYDNTIIDFMDLSGSSYVTKFGNCAAFYLEGLLYDLEHQYAVCDGIAKTFALLCGIEGIECYKVNGIAGGGNHAWNIVGFKENPTDTIKNYYFVDITWADRIYMKEGVSKELPTHYYFLTDKQQLEIEGTRTYSWNPITKATVDYDYYDNTTIDNAQTIDLLIDSETELETLADYCRDNNKDFVEFRIGKDGIDTMDGLVGNMDGSVFKFVDETNGEAPVMGMEFLSGRPVKSFEYNENTYLIDGSKVYITAGSIATQCATIIDHKFTIGLVQFIYADKQGALTEEMLDSFLQAGLGHGYSRVIFGDNDLITVWFE